MRFLVDNALSPRIADGRRSSGYDATRVREVGMQGATDDAILECAASEARVVVTSDTDFGALLAVGKRDHPSVVLLRLSAERTTVEILAALLANLPTVTPALEEGSIVVIEEHRVRVHTLPL